MNERWLRNQESSFPRIQEFHTASPITFKELGIQDLREKRLGLDNEPIIVISVKNSQNNSTNYFAFYDHPFVGAHLAYFLNAEAPIQVNPIVAKEAILDDYQMPVRAARPTDDGFAYGKNVERHQIHAGAPEIKVPYMEFVEQGLEQEIKALKNSKYDNLFSLAMELRIINDQAIAWTFSGLLSRFKSEIEAGKTFFGPATDDIQFTLQVDPIHDDYVKYLDVEIEKIETARREKAARSFFDYITVGQVTKIDLKFLESLDKEGQEKFIISRARLGEQIVVNPKRRETFGASMSEEILADFLDGNSFELNDANGICIQIEIEEPEDNRLYLPYRVTGYKFPKEPLENALYAVIAWNNQDGQRRFLAHHELLDTFPLLNVNWSKRLDAYLGRNLLGYFSPEITDKWPSEIAIEGRPRPQKMMGAQMAVRDSMDYGNYRHAPQLLAGSVIQKLEEHTLAG